MKTNHARRACQRVHLFRADRPRSSDHGSSSEGHARPCLVEMWRALARHARRDVRAAMRSSARAVSSSGRAGSAERPLPAAAASSAESIAGANTSEYLVKVPASLEAGMDAAQSTTRSRLLTLTSVAAAAYLGYFIFPLVGGGTASSAVQMCASKDVIFRKAGVARLRAVLRVSRDGAHVKHAVESGAGEILLRLVCEDGAREEEDRESRRPRRRRRNETRRDEKARDEKLDPRIAAAARKKASERRAVASDAADALLELAAVSEETREALSERTGFVNRVRAASKNVELDAKIRTKLAAFADVASKRERA